MLSNFLAKILSLMQFSYLRWHCRNQCCHQGLKGLKVDFPHQISIQFIGMVPAKSDWSWMTTVDYHNMWEPQLQLLCWIRYLYQNRSTQPPAFDMQHLIFSIHIRKKDQKQFVLTWERQQYIFTVLPQGYVFLASVTIQCKRTLVVLTFQKHAHPLYL